MAAKKTIAEEWKNWVSKGGSANNVAISPSAASTTSSSAGGGGGGSSERGQSALEWGLDIISRPMYAVTGALNQRLKNAKRSAAVNAIKAARGDNSGFTRQLLEGLSPLLKY